LNTSKEKSSLEKARIKKGSSLKVGCLVCEAKGGQRATLREEALISWNWGTVQEGKTSGNAE